MPERCVAALCSNVADPTKNISLHRIPFFGETCPIKQRRRSRWINFVLERRKNWVPGKTSSLCSEHFIEDDFIRPVNMAGLKLKRELKRDDVGVCVFPSRHAKEQSEEEPASKKSREQRMVVRSAKARLREISTHESNIAIATSSESHVATSGPSTSSETQDSTESSREGEGGNELEHGEDVICAETEPIPCEETAQDNVVIAGSNITISNLQPEPAHKLKSSTQDQSSQTLADERCNLLTRENDVLQRQFQSSQEALGKCQGKNKQLKRKVNTLTYKVQQLESQVKILSESNAASLDDSVNVDLEDNPTADDDELQEDDDNDDDNDTIEEEPDLFSSGGEDLYSESDEQTDTEDDSFETKGKSIPLSNHDNLRTEPKHIVFLSKLLLLFQFCHICRSDMKPTVTATQNGTEVVIKTACNNPSCRKDSTWNSQPLLPGTKTAAGNFLLCMATLFAGGSFTKVSQICQHMGLSCISLKTFFTHQRNRLFPAIHLFWKQYQANLMSQLKDLGELTMAGDGRHDSMGHCAKYCAYTIFCCTLPRIIHFSLVQRNQAGSSPAMEFMGFKKCMDFLIDRCGLVIKYFISDRHSQIAAHFKTVLRDIIHYFDLWHLKKKIRKVLTKICKEKGNEDLQPWVKPCERHLYWSATSTPDGNRLLIWGKFKSFLSHIVNIHSGFKDDQFKKCEHGEIPDRRWVDPDHAGYDKMKKALTTESLKTGIKQASPLAQTDCLEGFHSVLNLFAPKLIAYSYIGMYCRHILAALHFNWNLHRDDKVNEDDSVPLKVSYPKFKNGEATVRSRKVKQNFDYVEELYQFFMGLTKGQLQGAVQELKEMTPEPMNTMLEKQPREEAIRKRAERQSMVTRPVYPTPDPGEGPSTAQAPDQPERQTREQSTRARPRCSVCKNPMRGHRFIETCPKNRKET